MTLVDLEVGDVLLFKGDVKWYNFWTSKLRLAHLLIKLATFSPYVHAGIVTNANPKNIVIGEALDNGFTVHEVTNYVKQGMSNKEIDVYRYKDFDGKMLTPDQKALIQDEIRILEGSPYDWKDLVDLAIFIFTGKKFKLGTAKKLICSEAIADVYDSVNIGLVDKPNDEVTPADLGFSDVLYRVRF